MAITNRYCKVIFEKLDKNGNVEDYREFENSLDVKFNYQRFIGNAMHGRGSISVCGLNQQALDLYTSFFSEDVELAKRKHLKVIAGYTDDQNQRGIGTILDGSIVTAIPTMPPDVCLKCDIVNQYDVKFEKNNYNFKGTKTLQEVITWVAEQIGIKKENIDNRVTSKQYLNKKYTDFSFEGNKFDLVGKIALNFYDVLARQNSQEDKHSGIVAYLEGDKLIVDYQDLTKEDINRKGTPKVISAETGMVGIPQPQWAGQAVMVQTLLDPSITTGDIVELKSNFIKALNGYYYVYNITYHGEYRGNQWYSQFLCRRIK